MHECVELKTPGMALIELEPHLSLMVPPIPLFRHCGRQQYSRSPTPPGTTLRPLIVNVPLVITYGRNPTVLKFEPDTVHLVPAKYTSKHWR